MNRPEYPMALRDATTEELLETLPLSEAARDAILNLPVGTIAHNVGTGRWELRVDVTESEGPLKATRAKLVVSSTAPGAYSKHTVSVRAYVEHEYRAERAGHRWTYLKWDPIKLASWGVASPA